MACVRVGDPSYLQLMISTVVQLGRQVPDVSFAAHRLLTSCHSTT
jgi:hypothetical protein